MVEQPTSSQAKAQPYSEEQTTQWLAWLAYQMQQHDKTIFQIETIQPSWLSSRDERIANLLWTRILWGILAGLIFGVIFGLSMGLIGGLIFGVIFGLIGGLILGLIDILGLLHKFDQWQEERGQSWQTLMFGGLFYGLVVGLIFGLIFGVIVELIVELRREMIIGLFVGLSIGLIYGLIYGLIRTARHTFRPSNQQIQTVESLRWSWGNVPSTAGKGFRIGLIIGLIYGLIVGLIGGLIVELSDGLSTGLIGGLIGGLIDGLIYGLIIGLIGGLIVGLIGAFQPGPEELKTGPNQGMWLTLRSALKVGLPVGLVLGLLAGWLSNSVASGLLIGLPAFAAVALWYGGLDVLEHGIIRLILWWWGHAPLNYAKFLDYAANELNFLQKVGGGYVFIHRYLLEHFAEIAVERGYVEETTTNSDGN